MYFFIDRKLTTRGATIQPDPDLRELGRGKWGNPTSHYFALISPEAFTSHCLLLYPVYVLLFPFIKLGAIYFYFFFHYFISSFPWIRLSPTLLDSSNILSCRQETLPVRSWTVVILKAHSQGGNNTQNSTRLFYFSRKFLVNKALKVNITKSQCTYDMIRYDFRVNNTDNKCTKKTFSDSFLSHWSQCPLVASGRICDRCWSCL